MTFGCYPGARGRARAAGYLTGAALRLLPSLPGVGGAAAMTTGSAVIVHDVFRQVPALAVAALVAGAFGLLRDRRA